MHSGQAAGTGNTVARLDAELAGADAQFSQSDIDPAVKQVWRVGRSRPRTMVVTFWAGSKDRREVISYE